jgi:ketosteroid isomerase-like protein
MRAGLALLVATFLLASTAGAADVSATKSKLIGLIESWSKAFVDGDATRISNLLADDWSGQNGGGKRAVKSWLVGAIKSGDLSTRSMVEHDITVRVFGKIAVVQGAEDEQSTYKGHDSSGTYEWITVFENRHGKWVIIASQITKVSK